MHLTLKMLNFSHFSRHFDALPHGKIADHIDDHQTEYKFPFDFARVQNIFEALHRENFSAEKKFIMQEKFQLIFQLKRA